jgi:hypothetical protein
MDQLEDQIGDPAHRMQTRMGRPFAGAIHCSYRNTGAAEISLVG